MFEFKVTKKSKKSKARLGIIKTKNGVLHTPAFFPVATQASVKALDSLDIKKIGYEGVLANTYHLMLKPGSKLIKKMGGLHKFMNFNGVITTDSGGFQVFSLGRGMKDGIGKIAKIFPGKTEKPKKQKESFAKVSDKGVYFNSYIDGRKHFLTPEDSIKIQQDLGADIIFSFDECNSPFDNYDYTVKAVERTNRWAERSLGQFNKNKKMKERQAIFGIVQGSSFRDLREKSAKFISSLPFNGFGIGGPLGKDKKEMFKIIDWIMPILPKEKPRHLLGIGHLDDMKEAIRKGIDLFDCVYPTRLARHGVVFTEKGKRINLRKPEFLGDKNPIDKNCQCFVCQNYSRSYLSHLVRLNEPSVLRLLSYHNLWFYKKFIDNIRKEIKEGKL